MIVPNKSKLKNAISKVNKLKKAMFTLVTQMTIRQCQDKPPPRDIIIRHHGFKLNFSAPLI